jgi:hypothetical protein
MRYSILCPVYSIEKAKADCSPEINEFLGCRLLLLLRRIMLLFLVLFDMLAF